MRGARGEAAIEQAIERAEVIRRGERVLVACSGGIDSVALAAALRAVAVPMRLRLRLAHVNHGVRASAAQDECVALRVAVALQLEVDAIALAPAPIGEAALRDARYAALVEAARRFRASCVASAHHAEDQSESVLLALFRGTGPSGLAGMRARRPLVEGIDLVRPLLGVPSDDLRAYAQARALPYAVDPTNRDPELRRNAIRRALATLRPLFPGLDAAVARAAALSADERAGSPRAGLRREVRARLRAEGGLRDLDFAHVESAVRTLERGGSGEFRMSPRVRMRVERGLIAEITREP